MHMHLEVAPEQTTENAAVICHTFIGSHGPNKTPKANTIQKKKFPLYEIYMMPSTQAMIGDKNWIGALTIKTSIVSQTWSYTGRQVALKYHVVVGKGGREERKQSKLVF